MIALQIALGLAFWPVIFLWTSLVPLHWSSLLVRAVVLVAAGVAFLRKPRLRFVRSITFDALLLLIVLTVTGWTRLRAIINIALPPWIDSVQHTMLVRLFLIGGRVPASYEPFIPGATAFYHWGYHANAAALCWFAGESDPFAVASVILSFGQFLNALTPLFVYAATLALVRSRRASIVAATLASLVSFYPAYYVSWGRYTHLAGALLLLAWIAMATRLRKPWIAALIAAGLTLVHVRLAFFAATFALSYWSADVLVRRSWRRTTKRFALQLVVAAVILVPWFVHIRSVAGAALAPAESDVRWTTPAELRENLLWVPHTAELLSAATAGLSGMANIGPLSVFARVLSFAWWLAIVAIATQRRRGRPLLWTYAILATWTAITLLILRFTHLQFATTTSAAITVFIPICIAAGALIGWVIAPVARIAVAVIVAACAIIGVTTLSNIINPATVIATQSDVDALRWLRASTPRETTILGRVQPWYGGTFVGADGAYWASVLTDRRSLPPPSLYGWSGDHRDLDRFLARWREEYPSLSGDTLVEARRFGVTHVYFGRGTAARFGPVVYSRGGISIAALPR